MKKYKLIKELPFEKSPKIGYISEGINKDDEIHYLNGFWFNPENYPEFWELVVEKDYEILEYKTESGISCKAPFLSDSHQFYIDERCKIYSIKRISFNSIFTIGDFVNGRTISSFSINWMEIGFKVHCDDVGKGNINDGCFFELQYIEKVKQPLFTIEQIKEIENIVKNYKK